jgi:iron(III) transport system ATP-binding protein
MTIRARNLRKSFAGSVAVAGINLDISKGEMLVLLGPSGCGKTTTMRCIAGLETPDSGQIVIGERTVFDDREKINVPANKRQVGMVFQSYAIWPHMTVFENVAFPLEMASLQPRIVKERVREMLSLVGLSGLEDRGASYLSGGQMQRVALARSLVMEPSVLLFDEPLSNLDARLRDHLRVQIRELQTQLKITSVYVTHDQREALALADKIVVMQGGLVMQEADPITLYRNPKTSKTAEFLGYSNIFDASVHARERGRTFVRLASTGQTIRADVEPSSEAMPLAVCVRPDDVEIRYLPEATASANLPENTMVGEVLLASFIGSHMQYRVRINDDVVWEVLSQRIGEAVRAGTRVSLTVDPGSVLLLPKE